MNLIKRILKKLFYNPYHSVKSESRITMGNSILEKTFTFLIRGNSNKKQLVIGNDCILRNGIYIENENGNIIIGDNTFINSGTNLISASKIAIGTNVFVSWGCLVIDHDSHSLNYLDRRQDLKQQVKDVRDGFDFVKNKNWSVVKSLPVIIEDDVWIGFDAVILKGVTIGRGSIIGARSVVTKDVPPFTIVAGNPARTIRTIE